ncbi:hypothetical protein [Flavobacterium sp.]|uniref:HNH endonuclease n=1 Tax=Flavobacterium sp. TaxID=239 RepID=UPI0031D8C1AA
MKNRKELLIESIRLYLRKNDLDSDTTLYNIEDWKKREEKYLNDSEFVITSEGGLNFILNYGDSYEFYDLIESFGYFMEMGHSWSYGFYFDNELKEIQISKDATYSEKLKDKRWSNKRDVVREKAGFKCQDCGSQKSLEVHHCYYKFGLEPWQYPIDSLRCLCSNCHEIRGKIEMELRARMADLTTQNLKVISDLIYGGMKYYPEDKIFNLVKDLNLDLSKLKTKINKIGDEN